MLVWLPTYLPSLSKVKSLYKIYFSEILPIMQKLEWKRKHSVMKKEIANVFSSSSQNNEDALSDEDVDWLEPVKRAKVST